MLNGPEQVALMDDIAAACDRLALADPTRQLLPNRVLYELSGIFAEAAQDDNAHRWTDFNGSVNAAAQNLVTTFNARGHWNNARGAIFLRTIDAQLSAAGIAFAPKAPLWQAARTQP